MSLPTPCQSGPCQSAGQDKTVPNRVVDLLFETVPNRVVSHPFGIVPCRTMPFSKFSAPCRIVSSIFIHFHVRPFRVNFYRKIWFDMVLRLSSSPCRTTSCPTISRPDRVRPGRSPILRNRVRSDFHFFSISMPNRTVPIFHTEPC